MANARQTTAPQTTQRHRTPLIVWILAGLALATAVVSVVGALKPEDALSWVWPAGLGIVFGAAAWVMAAMWDTRKLPGILATVLCVLGLAAPLATGLSHRAAERAAAEALVRAQDAEAAGDGFNEEEAAADVRAGVESARGVGQAFDVGAAHSIVTRVVPEAAAEIREADPLAPASTGAYVLATVEVTNRGEGSLAPGSDLTYDLVLADGTPIDSLECGASLPDAPTLAADLAPGERGTYRVCFDVPSEDAAHDILSKAAIRVANSLGDGVQPGYWRVG